MGITCIGNTPKLTSMLMMKILSDSTTNQTFGSFVQTNRSLQTVSECLVFYQFATKSIQNL